MKKHFLFAIMFILSIMCAGLASALPLSLPLSIDNIEVDGVTAANRLSLDRGEEYEVEVTFTPTQDIEDMEIEAFISGYEYNYDKKISDSVPTDDYEANVTYKEEMAITIPNDVEEDEYKLRIMFSDRDGDSIVKNFSLKLDPVRDAMQITDIILSQNIVEAGNVLTAVIRVANLGQYDEEDIRVQVTIPELGLQQISYIDEIDYEDEESSEELYLRIPADAKSGIYNLDVKVEFDRKHQSVEDSIQISVKNNEELTPKANTVILIGSSIEQASNTKPGVYPLTITNHAKNSRVFTLSLEGVGGWADAEVNPASAIILNPQETVNLAVILTPNKNVDGSRVFTLNIATEGNSKQVPLTANILKTSTNMPTYLLIILALVVLGIFMLSFRKLNKPSRIQSTDNKKVDTYY